MQSKSVFSDQLFGDRFIKIGLRLAIVLSVAVLLGVGVMVWLIGKGAVWLASEYGRMNKTEQVGLWNPLPKLKNLLQSAGGGGTASGQVIKVVSEESQVIDVVKRASPAVVSILETAEVPKMEQCAKTGSTSDIPSEFQQFFGDVQIPSMCQNGTQKQRVGAGSGFLVSSNGYILTNKHVVSNEKAEYTVVLNDKNNYGKKVPAKVLARDPNNDVAVLKIDMNDLPFISFGDSKKLQVGQTAIAIGYALGQFDNTVSKGVISGLARSIEASDTSGSGSEELRGLIQTDAAINPGNSGGPLLDIAGNVVGMDVAMAQGQSIGFAIPINVARADYEQVASTGLITPAVRPFVGVRYVPVTPEIQSANKLSYDYGVLVVRGENQTDLAVVPGSPADKVGIQENDIILEVNGKQLNEQYLLSDAIDGMKPGDSIDLKIVHKGDIRNIALTLGKQ